MAAQRKPVALVEPIRPADKPAPTAAAPATAPRTWWQWLLVYPTIAVSMLGAVPTALELFRSSRAQVPFGMSTLAAQQDDVWARNLRCTEAPFDGLTNEFNVQVDATICKSGDVLVRFMGPGNRQKYTWVPAERFETRVSSFSIWGSSAMAQEPPRGKAGQVVCQWSPEAGKVVRRTRETDGNQCVNELIRTSSGEVISRQKVACDAPCSGAR